MHAVRRYEPTPTYPPLTSQVGAGWSEACGSLQPGTVLAADGPHLLDWPALVAGVGAALGDRQLTVRTLDIRDHLVPWDQVVKRTAPVEQLADDPHFATMAGGTLADLFDELPTVSAPADGVLLVYGPGAALVAPDLLWYADVPKRYAESAVTAGTCGNLGQPAGTTDATTRRLFYIDWPLLDRHRDALGARIDLWVDLQAPDQPTWLTGDALRATFADLACRPFRTRPTFNTTSWGGHWGQRELGMNTEAKSTALGYELIAPESGILVGERDQAVELPFQLLVALHPERMLGAEVHARFDTSFPIRFDYLDTVDGGNLSVHCHPQEEYMRDVFGWPYTQLETYYIMVGGSENVVYLGLHDGVDVTEFHHRAHEADAHGVEFDIEQFVPAYPAEPHQLFLIPGGTPHGSGKGNVVLEVSATPYLYSLRFYDWQRSDPAGNQRPVHVEHAFRNLDPRRQHSAVVRDLIQQPRVQRGGDGWQEEVIGVLPEMFFEVHRLTVDATHTAPDDTAGRFHVLNVVAGDGAVVTTGSHEHTVAYAETLVVPAHVGGYQVTALGASRAKIVKAFVR